MSLVSTGPVRTPKMSHVAVTGEVAMRDGRRLFAESNLEFEWLLSLDFHPYVERVEVQPFHIWYYVGSKQQRYTPDTFVHWRQQGRTWIEIHEVKYRDVLRKIWMDHRARFKAAYQQCRASGYHFKIVTDRRIKGQLLENAKFFRKYRGFGWKPHQHYDEALKQALAAAGTSTPNALIAAVTIDPEARLQALSALWRLIAVREVEANLLLQFDMRSPIWMPKP